MNSRPLIAVTMGDPAGIGPEICLQLLARADQHAGAVPVVFGDVGVLRAAAEHCGLPAPRSVISQQEFGTRSDLTVPTVVDLANIGPGQFTPGQISAAAGAAAYGAILAAIDAALAGRVAAVCTAPIHKESLAAAGVRHPGHTEIFAERTAAPRSCMMLTSEVITCSFVTGHVGYRDVPALLSTSQVASTIDLTRAAMRRLRGREPSLIVCGLNPHAGEHGLFGDGEEERIIAPAVEAARSQGVRIEGPLPPDTAFVSWQRARTDAYICMYHDQGLIPLKALAFDEAVNVTLGLPIVRTSVDHGTAFDIAWQNKANPGNLYQAFRLAVRLGGRA